jgi:undecaprenyl-diphosphatase UppP
MRSRGTAIGLAVLAAIVLILAALRTGEEPGALSNWQALVLGLVQGATELLPISSSGHLILVPWLFDWTYLEQHDQFNQTFDVALHMGTLVAVVAYFWHDLVRLVIAFFGSLRRRRIATSNERIAWFIVAATIPAGIVGFVGENAIADNLGEPWQIAIFLAVFGVLLWIADRSPQTRHMDQLTLGRSFVVGLAQTLALAPGVSRSGASSGSTVTRPRASRSSCSCRSRSPQSCSRASATCCSATFRPAGRGRSSSVRWPRQGAASSRSSFCSATCVTTTTRSSWSTA